MSPIELRVTLADAPQGERHDLVVRAGAGVTVADLARGSADALGRHDGGAAALWCLRRGRAISSATPLAQAGIRWGDHLVIGRAPAAAELNGDGLTAVVTGGPCAGRSVPLTGTEVVAGRGPECEIRLDDPSLSRRHLEIRVEGSTVLVRDARSSNGTAVDGADVPGGRWHAVRSDEQVQIGRTSVRFERRPRDEDARGADRGRVAFNRMPRVARPPVARRIELAPAPDAPRPLRLPFVPALVSMVAGLVMFLLLDSVAMLAFSALGPLMLLSSYLSDRHSGRRAYRREAAAFGVRLAEARAELSRARADERRERLAAAPDAAEVWARAVARRPELWERRPDDDDFLALRIALADLPARTALVLADGGDPALRADAERLAAASGLLATVPLVLRARDLRAIGLCGERRRAEGLARWLVIQAAAMHAPTDVVVTAAVGHGAAADWEWLKWLPHADTSRVLPELESAVVRGDIDARHLLERVRALQQARLEAIRARIGGEPAARPHLLLVLDEDLGMERALVGSVLADAAETGLTVVWLGRDRRHLPGACGAILELHALVAALDATIVASGHVDRGVSADAVDIEYADGVARALAPVRDTGADARHGEIPRRAGLLEMLELPVPSPEALAHRWRGHDGRLTATLGAAAGGPLTLDLGRQGPHALIVGTTGSGKSELLRTLVASMAACCPPDRLSFLLIDYKGSAAFAPCAAFPHVVDVVSNLDEHLAERALVALKAEIRRRERLLADARAKDLDELVRLDPAGAPPALVIAVDEFAQLRAEVPAFVDGVVDIARRGRSLGIHMILAAQSLQDAFTPAIRSNTNIRVALRVAEDGDSDSAIGARDAARIPSGDAHRGRGYVRTGHGELREFQAAYVSGRSPAAGDDDALALTRFDLGAGDLRSKDSDACDEPVSDTDTDLTSLALAAAGAQQLLDVRLPRAPWLPVLEPSLALRALPAAADGRVCVGLVDDPARQRQDGLELDLDGAGHVVLFGGGRSGKSAALRTAAVALAGTATPDALHLYALESAGRDMQELARLPHCGAIVPPEDGERVERLLAFLTRTIEHRALALSAAGTASFAQLGRERPPRIILLVDDLDAFAKEHDHAGAGSPWALLGRVLATGRAAGVHVLMTAERRGALPSAIASHVGQRLVLQMPATEDMLAFGIEAKSLRGARLGPGRGFTRAGLEFQLALAGGGPDHELDAVRDEAAVLCARYPDAVVPAVPAFASDIPRDGLPRGRGMEGVAIGIGGTDLSPALVALHDRHFLVVGSYRSGRSTALETLALGLAGAEAPPQLHLLAPRPTPLAKLTVWARHAATATACAELAAELLDVVRSRAGADAHAAPLVVFVEDAGDLTDSATQACLERIVRLGRDAGVRVVAAAETGAARAIGVPWLRELRKEGHGLLLRPDLPGDGDLLGADLPRRVRAPFPEGRGFLVRPGCHSLVQVAR